MADAETQTYLSLLFFKIKDSYYALDEATRKQITSEHVKRLSKYTTNITHLVCTGFNGQYDQVAMIESDNLRTIYDAAELFKMGEKGRHIEVMNAVFGIKVQNKSAFHMIGNR
jgi:chlorite dismutase